MSDGWQNIANILGIRNQRRKGVSDALGGGLSNIANIIYGKKQAERANEFTSGENEADRWARSDEATKDREHEAGLADVEHGYRMAEGAQNISGQVKVVNAQGQNAEDLANLNNDFRSTLQSQVDTATMNRVQAQLKADREAATALWEQQSKEYPEQQSYRSPTTSKQYSWRSEEEFRLAMAEMEHDNYVEAQRVIAQLRDSGTENGTAVWEAYEFAKNEIFNPTVMDNLNEWLSLQDVNPDGDLEQMFIDGVKARGLTDEAEIQLAVNLFRNWITTAQDIPGDDGADAGGETGGDTLYSQAWEYFKDHGRLPQGVSADEVLDDMTAFGQPEMEAFADQGFMQTLAATVVNGGQWLLGWIPGLNMALKSAAGRISGYDPNSTGATTPGELPPGYVPGGGVDTTPVALPEGYVPGGAGVVPEETPAYPAGVEGPAEQAIMDEIRRLMGMYPDSGRQSLLSEYQNTLATTDVPNQEQFIQEMLAKVRVPQVRRVN